MQSLSTVAVFVVNQPACPALSPWLESHNPGSIPFLPPQIYRPMNRSSFDTAMKKNVWRALIEATEKPSRGGARVGFLHFV